LIRRHSKPFPLNPAYDFFALLTGPEFLDVGARIEFLVTGSFNGSDFGITFGLPQRGSTLDVYDPLELVLEAPFVKPRG
jgi:hypothetical protein